MIWHERISAKLNAQKASQSYRIRRTTQIKNEGREIAIDGKYYLNFSSNDYLGLSQAPELIRAWQKGAEIFGVGSAGSGHIIGYNRALADLEIRLAQWLGYERAIVFPSGYSANQAVIKTLIEKDDRIIADRLSHASIMEAAMLSSGTLRRFHHNDLESLKTRLNQKSDHNTYVNFEGTTLVITEGLFSMDGDEAPLDQIQSITQEKPNQWLMIDDAHGIGVNGLNGRGTANQYEVQPDILVVTFGKAFGLSGAAVLCSHQVAEYFIQTCRPLIYSTSISPALAYTLSEAVTLIENSDHRREKLQENINYFRSQLVSIGLESISYSAIQPIIIGDNKRTLSVANHLQQSGVWVTAIRPPTVPTNGARLRLTLTASHQKQDIDRLIVRLHEVH